MASGRRHAADSLALAPVTFVVMGTLVRTAGADLTTATEVAAYAAAGCLCGIPLTPDLDAAEAWRERLFVQRFPILGDLWWWLWSIYAIVFAHRQISHLPIIGTLTRQVYGLALLAAFWQILFYAGAPIPSPERALAWLVANWPWYVLWLVGVAISDTAHWLRDHEREWGALIRRLIVRSVVFAAVVGAIVGYLVR